MWMGWILIGAKHNELTLGMLFLLTSNFPVNQLGQVVQLFRDQFDCIVCRQQALQAAVVGYNQHTSYAPLFHQLQGVQQRGGFRQK